ncbi:hypothetical protein EGS38_05815 [Neisseria chenwenguii]|nr:hypothetical protein EGS38_05815 [Neisseria chenwenguii]
MKSLGLNISDGLNADKHFLHHQSSLGDTERYRRFFTCLKTAKTEKGRLNCSDGLWVEPAEPCLSRIHKGFDFLQ